MFACSGRKTKRPKKFGFYRAIFGKDICFNDINDILSRYIASRDFELILNVGLEP